MTLGDVSWVMQGQSPVRGVLLLLAGLVLSSEVLFQTLKLYISTCVSIFVILGSPGPGTRTCCVPFITCPAPLPQAAFSGPLSSSNLVSLWDGGGGATFAHRGPLLFSLGPQVRLEQIRQAESLEQVRSLLDEAPLRDIGDIKDS